LFYPWIDTSNIDTEIIKVHPTQLYESIVGILCFFYLWQRRKKNSRPGSQFFVYLILAGVERFFVEFIRTNEKYLFDIFSGAQVISLMMVFIGSYFLFYPLTKSIIDKTS